MCLDGFFSFPFDILLENVVVLTIRFALGYFFGSCAEPSAISFLGWDPGVSDAYIA